MEEERRVREGEIGRLRNLLLERGVSLDVVGTIFRIYASNVVYSKME